jgi:VWFA-related protein
MMRKIVASSITCAAIAIGAPQTPTAQDRAAPLVSLMFRAVGEDGAPIADLKADELLLKVNGKPRDVASLQFVPIGGVTRRSELPPPFGTNLSSSGARDIYVVVDTESLAPGREQPVRTAIGQLIGGLSPGDRVALVTISPGGRQIGPTRDRNEVLSAVRGMVGLSPQVEETEDNAACRAQLTLQALKNIISMSGDASTTIVLFSATMAASTSQQPTRIGQQSGLCQLRTADIDDVAATIGSARALLYAVWVVDGASSSGTRSANELSAGLDNLAGATGGEMIRLTGDTELAMARVGRETSGYYLAAFAADPSERNGARYRVDLKVKRERVKVRVQPQLALAKGGKSPSPRDMLRVSAIHRDLPLRLVGYSSRNPGGSSVKVLAVFEPIDPAVQLTDASVGLFDQKGSLVAQWSAQSQDLARQPAVAALTAPPGLYRLRVAAVDAAGRGGSADYGLSAEIVRADPLTLSALALGVAQGGSFAPRLQFGSDPQAIGYLEVYGVPKNGAVSTTLELAENDSEGAIATATTTTAATTVEDVKIVFGGFAIEALPPGDYQVRAVVSLDGKPVGRVTRTLRKVAR